MASYAGSMAAWNGGYLDPSVAFSLHTTVMSQIAPILGGIYTLSGPILGTIATMALGEATRSWFGSLEGVSLLLFGVALVACVVFLPRGIRGALDRWLDPRPDANKGQGRTGTGGGQ